MGLSANLMPLLAWCAVLIFVGYLLGSLSFGVLVSRWFGLVDPRSYGSGNPGATNVLRSGKKWAAVLTLLLDCLKSFIPMLLLRQWVVQGDLALIPAEAALLLACLSIAALLGHMWPVFFGFRGGKGVATALGVLLGLDAFLGFVVLAVWLLMAAIFRLSSLAALTASLAAPFCAYLFWRSPHAGEPIRGNAGGIDILLAAVCLLSVLLIWRHKENIARLMRGQESRIGAKKDSNA